MSESFFSRWSRRKQEVRDGKADGNDADASGVLPEPKARPVGGEFPTARSLQSQGLAAPQGQAETPRPLAEGRRDELVSPAEQKPPPTLEDVNALTTQSDFTRFVAPDVAPEVKNAALKKLFADPHFNAMDGLDVYIDDYSKPDPLSPAMLKQLASAKFLKLFDEEPQAQEQTAGQHREVANNPPAQTVAQSDTDERPTAEERVSCDHADPDLRLQQDHAPGPTGTRSGSE